LAIKRRLRVKKFLSLFARLLDFNRTQRLGPYRIYTGAIDSPQDRNSEGIARLMLEFLEADLLDAKLDGTERLRSWLLSEIERMRENAVVHTH
jgi:hypothetical protein